MARIPMVTRTIISTEVTVLCLDIVSATPVTQVVSLTGTFKDDKSLFKAVESAVNQNEIKAVHIVSSKEVESLYGMTEQEFIAVASRLDANRKPIQTKDEVHTDTDNESNYPTSFLIEEPTGEELVKQIVNDIKGDK